MLLLAQAQHLVLLLFALDAEAPQEICELSIQQDGTSERLIAGVSLDPCRAGVSGGCLR
jgi:hypothetical protein